MKLWKAVLLFVLIFGIAFGLLWKYHLSLQAEDQADSAKKKDDDNNNVDSNVVTIDKKEGIITSSTSSNSSATGSSVVLSQTTTIMSPSDISTYIFCYPLVLMSITRDHDFLLRPEKVRSYNTLEHQRTLTGTAFESVVAPNDSLLYSSAWVKLPITVRCPPVTTRYVLFSLLDAYGNILWRKSAPFTEGWEQKLEAKDNANATWFIIRIFSNGESDDLNAAHDLQDTISLEGEHQPYVATGSGVVDIAPAVQMEQITPRRFYNTAQEFVDTLENVPAGILSSLLEITKRPDKEIFTDPTLLCCPEKVFALQSTETRGWNFTPKIGHFGEDYMLRAFIAKWLFAGNGEEDCHYFFRFGVLPNETYQMDLTSIPTTQPLGFWSVTLYNEETGFLLHEGSNSVLSTHILNKDEKSVRIYIKPNPNPLIQGKVLVIFRIYAPRGEVWWPPAMVKVTPDSVPSDAITLAM